MVRNMLALLLGLQVLAPVGAQDVYPSRTVRIVQPIPPGSSTDNVIRVVAERLTKALGATFIVDNRPGGGMTIGPQACSNGKPDGYTICAIASDNFTVQPHFLDKLPYDVEKDFKPVSLLFYNVDGLIASAGLEANSVAEVRALAQAKPGSLNFGTNGPGTTSDLFRASVSEDWKSELTAIPYPGGPPIVLALAANQIQLTRLGLGSIGGQLGSGKIKVLAVGGANRSRQLPSVPTYAEAGISFPVRVWWGLFVHAATPDTIVRRLNTEIQKIFADPAFRESLDTQFLEAAGGSEESFARIIEQDKKSTANMIRQFGLAKKQ